MNIMKELEVFCLKKANQASRVKNVIWAIERGESPQADDVSMVEDLFTEVEVEDLKGSYSFSDLKPPQENIPGDWRILLSSRPKAPKLSDSKKWKKYFNKVSSYYMIKADEFAQREDDL